MRALTQRPFALNERIFFIASFALLYVYLWLRAIYVPEFCDEIATFYHYIQSGRFLPYNSDWDANNHFLNSALTWLSWSVFGHSMWWLRLPNLLIAPLLFYAVYKIGQEIPDRSLRFLWIISVCFNHYFIEFSALARGYGMSMAFILMAVWYTIRMIKTNNIAAYVGVGMMSTLAILSNLTLIYSVLILLTMIFVAAILKNQKNIRGFFLRTGLLTATGLLPALWAISYLFEMKSRELLYYGIEGSLWQVTVKTLVFNSINGDSLVAAYLAVALFVVAVAGFVVAILKAGQLKHLLTPEFVLYYLLLGNIGLFVLQHLLLGLKYPEDRIGLFLIPYFLGSVIFAISRLRHTFNRGYIRYLALPLLYIPFSFMLSVNLTHITYWKNMGIDDRFYQIIKAASTEGEMPPVVGGHRVRRSLNWAFINYKDQGRQNMMHYADSSETTDDFLVVNANTNPGWTNIYSIIDYDQLRDIHLLKRKSKAKKIRLAENEGVATGDTTAETYFPLITGSLDTLVGRDLFFSWKLTLFSPDEPFSGAVVLDILDENQKSIHYHAYKLWRQRLTWDGSPSNAFNGIKYSGVHPDARYFRLYLWNIQGHAYFISDGKAMVTEFVKD